MEKESNQAHYRTNSRNVQLFMDEVKAERMISASNSVRLLDQTVDEMNLHSLRSSCKHLGRKPAARPITLFKVLVYANMEGCMRERGKADQGLRVL